MTERYENASALRQALETRLKQDGADTGTDLARRRRLVVFDRVAARLSVDRSAGWILKGGAALEFRLRSKARATKDMDLAACPNSDEDLDGETVRALLIDALALDEDGDGFLFQVSSPVSLTVDSAGRGGWRSPSIVGWRDAVSPRYKSTSWRAGRKSPIQSDCPCQTFWASPEPRAARSKPLTVANTSGRSCMPTYTRNYGGRPNTRVKDLVDLVLLIECGLVADAAVVDATRHVFGIRATHPIPKLLPNPPPNWGRQLSRTGQ